GRRAGSGIVAPQWSAATPRSRSPSLVTPLARTARGYQVKLLPHSPRRDRAFLVHPGAMRIPALLLVAASILPACRPAAAPPRPEPPHAVAPQPWGLKQCEAAPLDYPDPAPPPRPAPVAFTTLPLDPDFAPLGVPLVTYRSAELVFHVSPTLPQAVVD